MAVIDYFEGPLLVCYLKSIQNEIKIKVFGQQVWVPKPKLPELPSYYFRRQGYATFGEDRSGLAVAREFDLVDNFCWASDYPHPEGSWPHSPEAIERQMGSLSDDERAKVLGGNAARLLGINLP